MKWFMIDNHIINSEKCAYFCVEKYMDQFALVVCLDNGHEICSYFDTEEDAFKKLQMINCLLQERK